MYAAGERDGDVEQAEEHALATGGGATRTLPLPDDADGTEERDGDGGGEPGHEQDERPGVAAAVHREVELRKADVALGEPEHGAAALLGEVAHDGDERARPRERLRVGPRADVHAHEPDGRARDAVGQGQVPAQVHGRADGEHDPRRGHLVEQPRGHAHVAAQVLEEGHRGDRALVVPQRPIEQRRVHAERVRRARRRQDQEAREQRNHRPVTTCLANAAVSTSAATPPLNANSMALSSVRITYAPSFCACCLFAVQCRVECHLHTKELNCLTRPSRLPCVASRK
jgi:hypothetical protein